MIFGACKTATRECMLGGCSRSLDGKVVSSHPQKSWILILMFLCKLLINELNLEAETYPPPPNNIISKF